MSKKSHHFLTLWPRPLTYDLEKLIRPGHYHYQCVYQIWEQSIPWFLSYRVNTIAGGGRRAAGGGRLRRKTITSHDPSDRGDIIIYCPYRRLASTIRYFATMQNWNEEYIQTDKSSNLTAKWNWTTNKLQSTLQYEIPMFSKQMSLAHAMHRSAEPFRSLRKQYTGAIWNYVEPWIKWPTFNRWQFKIQFSIFFFIFFFLHTTMWNFLIENIWISKKKNHWKCSFMV